MTLLTFDHIEQGTDEWHAIRRGIVTASVVGKLITPKTVKPAANDTSRGLLAQLVAERITGFTESVYPNAAMQRGTLDEPYARAIYSENVQAVTETGFMIRDDWGFQIGYSPDGLVGDDGLIEIKSRDQKIQLRTFLDDEVPLENIAQIQCGLLVSGRKWCDYVSYSGGMPLYVKRVLPDPKWHAAILEAVTALEKEAAEMTARYLVAVDGAPTTERIDHYADMELNF